MTKKTHTTHPAPDPSLALGDPRSEEEILAQRAETPEEQSELSAMLREIHGNDAPRRSWPRRFGWMVAITTFATLGILTAVLIREVHMATRIYGPNTLIPGQQASFRISVFDPEKTRFYSSIQGEMWLIDRDRKHLLYRGNTPESVLIANVQVPLWTPGTHYRLQVTVTCPEGTESITRPISLQPAHLVSSGYAPNNNNTAWELHAHSSQSPYRVLLFAENRAPVADILTRFWLHIREQRTFPSHATSLPVVTSKTASSQPTTSTSSTVTQSTMTQLTVRSTSQSTSRPFSPPNESGSPDSKQPRNPFANPSSPQPSSPTPPPSLSPPMSWRTPQHRLQVNIQHGKSTHSSLTPNALGWVQFSYVPQLFDEPWSVSVHNQQHVYSFGSSVKPEGYQLVLNLPRVIHPLSQPLLLRVDGLYSKGDIHVDITQDGRILSSHQGKITGGRAALSLPIPPQIRGLVGVQVYSEFYYPGEIHDERLVFVGSPQRDVLFATLRKHLVQRGDILQALVLDNIQRSIPPHAPMSEWVRPVFALCKARFVPPRLYYDSAPQRLHNLRRYQQRFRFFTIAFLIGMSSCILLALFLWVYLDHQRDLKRVLEVEDSPQVGAIHGQKLFYLFAFILLLAAFFAAIILLFWAMQWTYDAI